jgi:hypothetical protein
MTDAHSMREPRSTECNEVFYDVSPPMSLSLAPERGGLFFWVEHVM